MNEYDVAQNVSQRSVAQTSCRSNVCCPNDRIPYEGQFVLCTSFELYTFPINSINFKKVVGLDLVFS